MSNTGNQEIKCNVSTCKHNEKSHYCTLHDITVAHEGTQDAHSCHDTICDSFQEN